MKCIIQIDSNGNIVNHPVMLDNFSLAFPDLDISGETAPPGWAWFTRQASTIDVSQLSPTQLVKSRYSRTSDQSGFYDEHYIYDLTADEIRAIVDEIRANPPLGFASWTLETTNYFWLPPIERPDGNYKWDEQNMSWVACATVDEAMPAKFSTVLTPKSALPPPPTVPSSPT
jgi:hypothetical protein